MDLLKCEWKWFSGSIKKDMHLPLLQYYPQSPSIVINWIEQFILPSTKICSLRGLSIIPISEETVELSFWYKSKIDSK